jgi:hypothetical protein
MQQRNTMTNYFPVLHDGAGSRGSDQFPVSKSGAAASAHDSRQQTAGVVCEPAVETAELQRLAFALQNDLECAKQECSSLRYGL